MATLHVRNFPDGLYALLRSRAEQQGRSIGAEAITIIGGEFSSARTARRLLQGRRARGRRAALFERFTERARRAVTLAEGEARALGHGYVGTEHFLIGLLREGECVAARILANLDMDADSVRTEVVELVGRGPQPTRGQIPFTPHAKQALELALREAIALGHEFLGTEHLLLALAREELVETPGQIVLTSRGATYEGLCNDVRSFLYRLPGRLPEPDFHTVPEEEYRAIALNGTEQDWTEQLNAQAADGWELFSLGANGYRAIFRRRRDD
jgi:plasmid stability protein